MLVLTRHEDQEIVIGDPANPTAVIRVVRIAGDRVRLGIEAARELAVHRREIANDILAQRGAGAAP